jgi:hypothetical protein
MPRSTAVGIRTAAAGSATKEARLGSLEAHAIMTVATSGRTRLKDDLTWAR